MQPLKASLVSCCPSWKMEAQAGLRLSDLPTTCPVHREAQWSEPWTPGPVLSIHSSHYKLGLTAGWVDALSGCQRAPVWPPLSASSGPRLFPLLTWLQHHLSTQPAGNDGVIFRCPLPAPQPGWALSSQQLLFSNHPLRSGSPCVLWQWPSRSSLQLSDSCSRTFSASHAQCPGTDSNSF